MHKTSEWLFSFNSNANSQIQAVLSQKKDYPSKTIKVSITGGKGGVGKTSMSLKMAKELAKTGFKVLLIDCDYNLSNTAIKLGLPVENTFYSLLTAQRTFEECLYKEESFDLLAACNGNLDFFESNFRMEEFIIDILNAHQDDYDFVLLDCPAGLTREALILNAYSDHRIVVVTPDKSSITDSYSLIKVLSAKYGVKENHLLVNQYETVGQYEKVVKTLSETVENFLGCRTHILGGIPKIKENLKCFDTFFLGEESITHKKFLKVLARYTDELSKSLVEKDTPNIHCDQKQEQEVQNLS